VVDRTGAHGPTDELIAVGLAPVGVTITSGEAISWAGRNVSVPKSALVTKLVSIAQGALCSQFFCALTEAELPAGCQCGGRSASPWFGGVNVSQRSPGPAQL
jgi:hypothetical protein